MKIIESFKETINNSLKEIQENTGKQVEMLKEETNKSLKEIQENNQKGEGIELSSPRPKSGSRNNKENTNGGKPGNGKPGKEVRN
jgi:predicted HicB family RNase H-like nuclease